MARRRRSSRVMTRRPLTTIMLATVFAAGACTGGGSKPSAANPQTSTTQTLTTAPPTTVATPSLRTPNFGTIGEEATTVKVVPSFDPTLVLQFPLVPSSIKMLFPKATGLVTVVQGNPAIGVVDTVTIDVANMPPDVKFTVFYTELAAKPFGHASYVGDLITRGDGRGESVLHVITLTAFAADNRSPVTSADQSGVASGVQLEHVGLWFDNLGVARTTLQDPTVAGTPFDGGPPALHAGPQAMTDGQDLPVI